MKEKKVIEHITSWMLNYANKANSEGFVVGVSGGIDSALTSTLAAETGKKVLLIEMPIHQHESQVSRAQEHISFLKNKYKNASDVRADLTPLYEQFIQSVGESDLASRELALVNTRARLRMTTLYYYAQLNNLLVAGTGNKIEDFGVGFYTKYGDGGVDISPIADLMKSQVYALAKSLGVPESIQNAAPTDGLWGDDKTDEDQLGASYDELEWAMNFKASTDGLAVENKENLIKKLSARQQEVLSIYTRLNNANKHKMLPIPVCKIPEELM
jgi:NAD+ synthase